MRASSAALLLLLLAAPAQGLARVPVALVSLAGPEVNLATAREVRHQLLEAFAADPDVRLFDPLKQARKQGSAPKPPYQPLLQRGLESLAGGRFAAAVKELQQAVTTIEPALAQLPKAALSDAVVHLAAAQLGAGRHQQALDTLKYLLTWRAQHPLLLRSRPPSGWPQLTARARRWLAQAPSGNIQLVSLPPHAEAFVDGRRLGPTPVLASNLTLGTHYISLHLEGYRRLVVPVQVTRRQQTAEITLRRDADTHALLAVVQRLRPVLGQAQIPALNELRPLVGANRALLVEIDPTPSTLQLTGYLYDLDRCRLLRQQRIITGRPPVESHLLALQLWRVPAIAPSAATQAPAHLPPAAVPPSPPQAERPRPAISSGTPWYRQWWVWAAAGTIGAASLGLAIALPLTLNSEESPSQERLQLRW